MTQGSPALKASSEWRKRWCLLAAKIERIESDEEEQLLLQRISSSPQPLVVAFANAHAMNSIVKSASFFEAMRSADVVLRDGSGMATLFKLLGTSPGLNLNGTDFIPKILRRFNGRRIAFFGTQEPFLSRGSLAAAERYAPESTFVSAHGFLEVDAYLALAATHQPDLIVLGMGMPRQEIVAAALRSTLDCPCVIVCGGAIIDFLAGRTPRAPRWIRRAGMEWAFRLALEPKRLFQRYVVGNPVFLTRALVLAASSEK